MIYTLLFTPVALGTLRALESDAAQERRLRRLRQSFVLLETEPLHPGLRSKSYIGPDGEDVWKSVADIGPGGKEWPFYWRYGPRVSTILVLLVEPYPT